MKRTIFLALLTLLSVILIRAQETSDSTSTDEDTPPTLPQPAYSVEGDGVVLDVYFNVLRQGRAGVLHLDGENIVGARASWSIYSVDFFQLDGRDGWWAFLASEISQTIRTYELTVTVEQTGISTPQILQTGVNVITGGFLQQEVRLVPDDETLRLLDPEVESAEFERIFEITGTISDVALWEADSFVPPATHAELTSPFGASRVFNDDFQTIHTGWDFNAPTGTPLMATAGGRVAFAGRMDIRGNYVLIDHGRGVYSGYAHLSVIYVTQGQTVSEEQIIGMVGSTGRSSSAHAHFEMIVNGLWVDSADFVQMYVP
ncbi:MAG: M23 family metallopeptidase [Anaerolineae bacterium]